MKILTRYIGGNVIAASIFGLLALLSLFAFFDVLSELTDIGRGGYSFSDVLVVVALKLPRHAFELMPLAVLIGTMVAMSLLAGSSEYAVMRTSGMSLGQVASILAGIGALFAVLTFVTGEFAAPWAEQASERTKLQSTGAVISGDFRSGAWIKDDNHFINVREMLPDNTLLGINIYTYDKNDRLTDVRYARRAIYQPDGSWQLEDIKETRIEANRTIARDLPSQRWESILQPELLSTLLVEPERMSVADLGRYIEHLATNRQNTLRYEIALWGKLFYPLACLTMALVALAFTPVNQRQSNLGSRIFVGILIGLAFYFINRLFGHLGLLYGWSPPLVTLLPTLIFLAVGTWFLVRQERR